MRKIATFALVGMFLLILNPPTILACKVMGQATDKKTKPEEICRKECTFHGGWTGKMDDRLKGFGTRFVDCYCQNPPPDALCQ